MLNLIFIASSKNKSSKYTPKFNAVNVLLVANASSIFFAPSAWMELRY